MSREAGACLVFVLRKLARAGCGLALIAALGGSAAVEGPLVTIELQDGETIRDVAGRLLKDADLWPQILELSGISSVTELRPGVELKIPAEQVARADEALSRALGSIQKATAEGAQLFAPIQIGTAIDLHEEAVNHRKKGAWADTTRTADEADTFAGEALDIALAKRDQAAEAMMSDAHGSVEGRRPAASTWTDRIAQDILIEQERVRTLSSSTAQITFRDLSRVRLNPNSNALIERMRADPMTRAETAKVTLVEGDFYALLNGLSERNQFEVEVPGVEAEFTSRDFWVSHDEDASRFANYDEGSFRITARGQTIDLGQNEGALVPTGEGEAQQVEVLTRPELVSPIEGARSYNGAVDLDWNGVEEAVGYWLEIASDVDFNIMRVSQWGIEETAWSVDGLDPGTYYWRISALDALGLPGARSRERRFTVVDDTSPPFLIIETPGEGEILREARVEIRGESEPDVRLEIKGQYVPVGPSGNFSTEIEAADGANAITARATDPAGNVTERVRRFTYRPDRAARIGIDQAIPRDGGVLLTARERLTLEGETTAEPGSKLSVRDADGALVVEGLVGQDRRFSLAVPATEAEQDLTLELTAVSGAREGTASVSVRRDSTPPTLALDLPPPAATARAFLELTGTAEGAAELIIGGTPVPISAGRFDTSVDLAPGENEIELIARDLVGNVALRRIRVVLDREPPAIGAATAARRNGEDGPIDVTVSAADPSGLRQVAAYRLEIAGAPRDGYLQYDTASGTYRETLPPRAGELRLREVTVEDYAGNVTRAQFD